MVGTERAVSGIEWFACIWAALLLGALGLVLWDLFEEEP
jgi:hypothetical protein